MVINIFHQSIRITESLIATVFQINHNDMVIRNTLIYQMLVENIEQQERFPRSTNSCNHFYHVIVFMSNQSVKISFTCKIHISF